MKRQELRNIQEELKRLKQLEKQLEDELQQEFLDNIEDKDLALETFLERCKELYESGLKVSELRGPINWGSLLKSSCGIEIYLLQSVRSNKMGRL